MNVGQLKRLLDLYEDEQEVRFMYQENYPLQDHIHGVWQYEADQEDLDDYDGWDEEIDGPRPERPKHPNEGIVYIVSAGQVYNTPYGHRAAWSNAERVW